MVLSEDRLQQECFIWFSNDYKMYRGLLFHVPNGGFRLSREAAKLKTMGVVSGVSDLIFLWKGRVYFFELKTKIGKQSKDQIRWESLVKNEGFNYFLIRTFEEFKKEILHLINKYD